MTGGGSLLDAFVFYIGNIFYLSRPTLSLALSFLIPTSYSLGLTCAQMKSIKMWARSLGRLGAVGGIKKWGGRKEGLFAGRGKGALRLRVFKNRGLYIFNISREIANGTLCSSIATPSISDTRAVRRPRSPPDFPFPFFCLIATSSSAVPLSRSLGSAPAATVPKNRSLEENELIVRLSP